MPQPYSEIYEIPNNVLRTMDGMVIICRAHYTDSPYPETEAIALCKRKHINYLLPRLRDDARDLRGVEFHWWDVMGITDHMLDMVKSHLRLEDEIKMYIRRLELNISTHE
jgi:hypothetical protein